MNTFCIDSRASDYLIPSRGDLGAYNKFAEPVEISAAGGGKIYAYGSGTLQVADLRDVYYAPGLHARLVSLGEIEGQGWDVRLCDGGMELRNRDGDLFANIAKVNNVYPVGLDVIPLRVALAACMTDGDDAEPTHDELVDKVAMVANGIRDKGDTVDLGPVIHLSRLWLR